MQRYRVIIGVLFVMLFALVPYGQAQEEGAGYSNTWRQWRQRELQEYFHPERREAAQPVVVPEIWDGVIGYSTVWWQWRQRELRASTALAEAVTQLVGGS